MPSDKERIMEFLLKEAQGNGVAVVREACHAFLKLGMKAAIKPEDIEKRVAVPFALTKEAWLKQKGRCKRCNEALALDEAEGDHIIPRSQGGKTEKGNISAIHGQTSKVNCNASKGDNDLRTEFKKTGRLFTDQF